jgi:hypothetical protein
MLDPSQARQSASDRNGPARTTFPSVRDDFTAPPSSSFAIDPSLCLTTLTMASLDPISNVITSLKRESIIPDVLPESFVPLSLLSVTWPSGSEALLGNELEKANIAEEPSFLIVPLNIPTEQAYSDKDELTYTVAFFDPDAPSRADAKYKSFRHWVVRVASF